MQAIYNALVVITEMSLSELMVAASIASVIACRSDKIIIIGSMIMFTVMVAGTVDDMESKVF